MSTKELIQLLEASTISANGFIISNSIKYDLIKSLNELLKINHQWNTLKSWIDQNGILQYEQGGTPPRYAVLGKMIELEK